MPRTAASRHRGERWIIRFHTFAVSAHAVYAHFVLPEIGNHDEIAARMRHRRMWMRLLLASGVDATAAGDTFDGAFLARYVAGDDPFACARYANAAAALSTQGYGAVAPMPRRADVDAFLREDAA